MTKFSKSQFELVAEVLRETKPVILSNVPDKDMDFQYGKKYEWDKLVDYFSYKLEATNPAFNRDKFLKACGYGD